ncbi:Zinc knuckle CX2CX4HX4C [Arabidopsis suecica]|uniref:Zinc knuckle CX2CX4HX4C n=1 Tax=Arabidopsis suecica TaxID=45249 RepID=A0A8T2CLN0_ARASU|nr:Zinc knuckle CX2CX4HX4C [Arabidopsis suecica]
MISFQYERMRRICSHCLQITHQRINCPHIQLPQTPRNSPEPLDVPCFNRRRSPDENRRSNLNSQSQNSDYSFPPPLTPPPRLDSPPPNPEEFAAAYPHFHESVLQGFQQSNHPTPRTATWRRQPSTESAFSPNTTLGTPSNFEVGESSKRPNSHSSNSNDDRNQKTKDQATGKGGILKPPKKR